MIDLVEQANPADLESAGEALQKARDAIAAAARELGDHIDRVDWEGEAGRAFRKWGKNLVKDTHKLSDFADAAGVQIASAGAGLASVRSSMPPRDMRTDPKAVDDIPSPKRVDGNADYEGAVKAEKHRQEAINQMNRLASFYRVSQHEMAGQEPPTFSAMPDVGVPRPEWGPISPGQAGGDVSPAATAGGSPVRVHHSTDSGGSAPSGPDGAGDSAPPRDEGRGLIPPADRTAGPIPSPDRPAGTVPDGPAGPVHDRTVPDRTTIDSVGTFPPPTSNPGPGALPPSPGPTGLGGPPPPPPPFGPVPVVGPTPPATGRGGDVKPMMPAPGRAIPGHPGRVPEGPGRGPSGPMGRAPVAEGRGASAPTGPVQPPVGRGITGGTPQSGNVPISRPGVQGITGAPRANGVVGGRPTEGFGQARAGAGPVGQRGVMGAAPHGTGGRGQMPRRPVSNPDGVVGTPKERTSVVGARRGGFTAGGTGLVRGPVGDRRRSEEPEDETSQRPDYLVEDEETHLPGGRRHVPPVID